jgi:hydroxyacylglutathione hydrolase
MSDSGRYSPPRLSAGSRHERILQFAMNLNELPRVEPAHPSIPGEMGFRYTIQQLPIQVTATSLGSTANRIVGSRFIQRNQIGKEAMNRRRPGRLPCMALLAAAVIALVAAPAFSDSQQATTKDQRQAARPEVKQIKLSFSNMYLIKAERPVLIDAGSKSDLPALEETLKREDISLEKVAAVIVTHGHSDHAGLGAELQRRAILVVAGAGDRDMTASGRNDDIKPTNLMARILKQFFIDPIYPPFTADIQVSGSLDLHRFGIEGRAVQMPGHTPGSLAVILDDGRAFVGDMMLGGWMGGALFADQASEHYFQPDLARNRANIVELLRQPIETFYLGHGGPVNRASVLAGFDLNDPRATNH